MKHFECFKAAFFYSASMPSTVEKEANFHPTNATQLNRSYNVGLHEMQSDYRNSIKIGLRENVSVRLWREVV